MKPATKTLSWIFVEFHGRADLFDFASLQNDNAVGHGHGFHLVMGHINHGGVGQVALELGNFHAHLHAERRIKI